MTNTHGGRHNTHRTTPSRAPEGWGRVSHRLSTKKLALGMGFRTLQQREANDRRSGWLTEATWEVARHFCLGGGFNFIDFSDNNYSVYGWFLRAQGRY